MNIISYAVFCLKKKTSAEAFVKLRMTAKYIHSYVHS